MRKAFLLSLLLAVGLTSTAQRIHGNVAAGGMFSQIEGDGLKGFKQFGLNTGVGVMMDLSANGRWLLSVEALFAQRGAFQNNFADSGYLTNLYLNYVDIPVLLVYHDPIGGIYAGAGLTYGRLVQQPHSVIYYHPAEVIPDTNMTFLRNDLAATIDVRFTLWRGLMLNLRWQHSILPVRRDWEFAYYNGVNPDGSYRYNREYNNAYNHAISLRLIWQF